MPIPDWNADIEKLKKILNPKWSPCSPTDKNGKAGKTPIVTEKSIP